MGLGSQFSAKFEEVIDFMNSLRIFVTGATGFVGSHFSNYAISCGHKVIGLRQSSESKPRICVDERVEWVTKDCSLLEVKDFVGCDAVVHLAAIGVPPKEEEMSDLFRFNSFLPEKIISKAHEAGVRRVIMAGSVSEYGVSGKKYKKIPTWAPLMPVSYYAASKTLGFYRSVRASRQLGIKLCYCRIASAYGPGQYQGNLWPSMMNAAQLGIDFHLTRGAQIRDFVPIEAVAEMFLDGVCRSDLRPGIPKIENLGTGNPTRVSDWILDLWRQLNPRSVVRVGSLSQSIDDIENLAPQVSPRIRRIATRDFSGS